MGPVAGRNTANALIVAGLVPVLLWLYGLGFLVMHPRELLPWTAAGIIMETLIYPSLLMQNRSTEDRDEATDADGI